MGKRGAMLRVIRWSIFLLLWSGAVFAQFGGSPVIPTLLGGGSPPPTAPTEGQGASPSPPGNAAGPVGGAARIASPTGRVTGPRLGTDTVQYDPSMDNRLKAPSGPEGLFGRSIFEVERLLRTYGARPYSYAFGKYSRMSFSVYFLTLLFDRNRKLGGVIVSPKPPFTKVEPQVQQFLLKVFLASADLSKFQTVLGPNRLEIWFEDNRRFGQSILEALDRQEKTLR